MSIKIDVVDINNDDYDVTKRSKKLKTKSSTTKLSICKKFCFFTLIFSIIHTLILILMLTFCFDFLIKIVHLTPGTRHHNDTNKNIFELIESVVFVMNY
ncbi:hypothetical protein DERP_010615 [Dermatophagoides pteronyssinus]|uniref:Uncharacterized protein n=1 Tax=Dermatophagoides pteronyssinus TaxID=6956 RepID=A0ABQ8JAI5_DERPT|nr:hypothetical protein DERP_010615 [Dermatophagoides pteronyssinus]